MIWKFDETAISTTLTWIDWTSRHELIQFFASPLDGWPEPGETYIVDLVGGQYQRHMLPKNWVLA